MTTMHFQTFNRETGLYYTVDSFGLHAKGFETWKKELVECAREAKIPWRLISAERLKKVGHDPLKTRLTAMNNSGYTVTIKKPHIKHPYRLRARTRRCYLEGRVTYPEAPEA